MSPMQNTDDRLRNTGPAPMHLLIPMDATERSRWAIRYALQQRAAAPVRVTLLFVAVPPDEWRVLRFQTEDAVLQFQIERGKLLMEDAAEPVRQAGIDVQCQIREGDVVFQILDAAEQCGCDAIVLPLPYPHMRKLMSTDVVREVVRRRRAIPVVTVRPDGASDCDWIK